MNRVLATLVTAAVLAAGPALAQGGYLGVQLQPAPEGSSGALIGSVTERSAASIMGLQPGDLVTAVDGIAVADAAALSGLIGGRLPGDIVELDVTRGGESRKVLGVLARRPGAVAALGGAPEQQGWGRQSAPLRRMPRTLEIPDMDFSWLEDFEPRFQDFELQLKDLQLDHQKLLEQIQERMRTIQPFKMDGGGFGFRFDGEPGSIFLHPGEPLKAGDGTSVQLRYPESTPPEERERLRREAIEKYGEAVEVEFAGTGTSVIIKREFKSGDAKPAGEAPAEERREF